MNTVPTATGEVAADEMGVTLTHEHVFANLHPTEPRDGYLTVREEREDDLRRFSASGGRTIWDLTNGELSRFAVPLGFDDDPDRQVPDPRTGSRAEANVLAVRAVAETTGVTIVLGTGHYVEPYLEAAWWDGTPTNRVADYLVADLLDGFGGTGIRAGLIGEVGSDLPVITAREERSLRAAGRAAAETGVLVSTHAPTFPTGEAQIDLLVAEGVAPERIVIGHSDTVKSLDYSLALLRRGVWVQYDCMMAVVSGGTVVPHELDRRVRLLSDVVARGYGDRILLSQDVSQRSHQAAMGGPGLTFVLDGFRDAVLAAGVAPEVYDAMLVDNPRRALFGV
jgi:predicted metal-dependent phosphotriesterase family hydrolase